MSKRNAVTGQFTSNTRDMIGKTFGRLTGVEYMGTNNHKQAMWKWSCACGKSVVRSGTSVRDAAKRGTVSCGCLRTAQMTLRGVMRRLDCVGSTYGMLTLVEAVDEYARTFRCKCECGAEVIRTLNALRSIQRQGYMGSCGCMGRKTGDKKHNSQGYVLVYRPNYPKNHNGWVKEHHLVWWENTGELVPKDHHIHHLNGIRGDNRFKNLDLRRCRDHPVGASVYDLIPYCINQLNLTGYVRPDLIDEFCKNWRRKLPRMEAQA